MAQYQRSTINPSSVSMPLGRYSQLARVKMGELLFLAGQVGVDADGKMVGKGDVGAQVRQIYKNIGDVLKSAGASWTMRCPFCLKRKNPCPRTKGCTSAAGRIKDICSNSFRRARKQSR